MPGMKTEEELAQWLRQPAFRQALEAMQRREDEPVVSGAWQDDLLALESRLKGHGSAIVVVPVVPAGWKVGQRTYRLLRVEWGPEVSG
jgi:hypothetical protein